MSESEDNDTGKEPAHDRKEIPPVQTRVTYVDDVESAPRRGRTLRRDSSDSFSTMSIRAISRQRTIPPNVALPPTFRTLSFEIEAIKRKSDEAKRAKAASAAAAAATDQKSKRKAAEQKIEFTDVDYHTASVETLLYRFSSSIDNGLSVEKAAQVLKAVGPNVPSRPPSRWFQKAMSFMFGNFGTILFIACILVFISWKPLGDPPAPANLALAIVLALVWAIQAFFSFWQDFSSSRVMASISTMLPDQCKIVRGGMQQSVNGRDVVPGDIIQLTMGDKLPADVRFVDVSSDVRFDRSILTGETMPLLGSVESTDENYLETQCIGMAGTHCVSGYATGLVVETGDSTVFGRIAKLTSAPKTGLTPLQKEILYFVGVIICLMTSMIIVVIAVWAGWLRNSHPDWISVPALIVDCVSVAVAFVPEGLPIAVTASLTIVANIMRRNKILCKSLKTVETLGAVNVICSDKTGTLTRNQMDVTDCTIGKKRFTTPEASAIYQTKEALQQLVCIGGLCNSAEFDPTTVSLPIMERKVHGDATDSAILKFTDAMKSVTDLRVESNVIFRITFNSKNKFAIAVLTSPELKEANSPTLTIKGAPDVLLPRCSSYLEANGEVSELTEADIKDIEIIKDDWSSHGKRVILLARKAIDQDFGDPVFEPRDYENNVMEHAKTGLILVGLVAIVDPPRPEISEVVNTLRGAGIKVFMVTGDFKLTAQAIAAECNIISRPAGEISDFASLSINEKEPEKYEETEETVPRALVLSGSEIPLLTPGHWDAVCKYDEIVFARTTPEHKLRIVRELQAREFTVGMTGDGVNDAPSLKAADVGIAMGGGSDVAIEAADMVLLDSFSAIVEAVKYGRVVYDNLKKTICYLLPAGSFSEFWPVITNVVLGLPQILSSFLMIIICCFTDCAASIAIAYEKPEADVLRRPPRNAKKDRLVDWRLILQAYGFIGIIEATLSFTVSYWFAERQGLSFSTLWLGYGDKPTGMSESRLTAILNEASSIYFVNLVVMQWFSLFALRTRRLSIIQHPPWRNWYLFPAIIFSLVVALIFIYVPKFHEVLGTVVIPVQHWFLPFGFGAGILLLDEARKAGVRKWPGGFLAKCAW